MFDTRMFGIMSWRQRDTLTILAVLTGLLAGCALHRSAVESSDAQLAPLIEEAVVYAVPVYEIARTRYRAVSDPGNARRSANQFRHLRALADHTSRGVTAPNNDTLYSSAWLDLSVEPLVLSVPDMAGRYYSLQFMDIFTSTFATIGRRTTGTAKRDVLVAGPDWGGRAPAGMTTIRSPSHAVWLLGRILVDGPVDLPAAHRLQDGITLTSLSAWSGVPAPSPRTRLSVPIAPLPDNAENFVAVVNQVMSDNPLPDQDRRVLARIARAGIGPGAAPLTPSLLAAWKSGFPGALAGIRNPGRGLGQPHAGWEYPQENLGNFGTDYRYRARVAIGGLGALEPSEAMYMLSSVDGDGAPLDGARSYRLRLPPGGMPVNAFWSLTLYEHTPQGRFLVDNPLRRYSIGDRSPGLRTNSDGSIDIYIQNDSPGLEREANWLPAPAGPFMLSMRAYQPREDLLAGRFRLPALQRTTSDGRSR
jgi:hypothetical protein